MNRSSAAAPSRRERASQTLMQRVVFWVLLFASCLVAPAAWAAADPQVASLVDNPDPVPAGGLVSYSIGVDNSGVDPALNTVLTLPVPAGATFVSASPAGDNCSLIGSDVVCLLGSVAGGATRNPVIVLRALGPGPATLTVTATVTADNDSNLGNNSQSQTTTVIAGADLALAKSGAPNPVVGGANVTYTLTPSNLGPNIATGIRIVDTLPPALAFVSAAGPGWSCANAAGVVTCDRPGPHAVGAAIPAVTLVATVNASGGTVTNSATVAPVTLGGTPGVADPVPGNNTVTLDTTVLPGADVRINQKTVISAQPAIASSNVTFQIQPRNGGPATAINARVTDVLPAGWAFVSASGPNWACAAVGLTVTCNRANFPVGATDNITLVATAPDTATVGATGTTYTNTATITNDVADPNGGNNAGSVNILVLPDGADLRLTKSKTPNPVAQGSNLTSTINVTNGGPRVATGPLRVVELLAGEVFVSASGSGWTCTPNGSTVVCDHPNAGGLAVNASLPTLTIVTLATAANASATNTACTGNSIPPGAAAVARPPLEGDPNPTNDCITANSTSTTLKPDLDITKITSTPSGGDKTVSVSEASVTYTLLVTNQTTPPLTDAATGIVIVDAVPAFIAGRTPVPVAVATPSGGSSATFACGAVGAQVTCTQTGGQLQPGESVSVAITVQRPMQDGSFTNTATVANTVQGDPNPNNNSASDTVTIDPIADVQMTGKTVTPAAVRAGEPATYVLSYRNNGPSPALGVVVSDVIAFPPGDSGATVTAISSSKGGSTCSIAAGAVLNPGANSFSCTIGTLANGEVQSITLTLRPRFQAGNPVRVWPNTASVTTTSAESPGGGDNGNNSQTATLTVNPAAVDLLVNKTDWIDPIGYVAGTTFIDYRVRVTSNGPSYATGVRITELATPPAARRLRFVCDTDAFGSSGSCNAVSLCSATNITGAPGAAVGFTCSPAAGNLITGLAIGDLGSGQSKDILLRFEAIDGPAPLGDQYQNVVSVSANEPDTFPANDSTTELTTVRQRVDLAVTKTANLGTVTINQPFTWTVGVTNNGPGSSVETNLTDTLPAGVEVIGVINWTRTVPVGSGTCSVIGSTITCGLGQLDATGVATITIPARIVTFPAGGSLTNNAAVDVTPSVIGGVDTNPANNAASHTINVTRSSLGGTIFQDRIRDAGNGGTPQASALEPRIGGVTVTLAGTDAYGNAINRSTTTAADGTYSFGDLPPSNAGGYAVTETQPAGFVNGPIAPPAFTLGGTYTASINASGDSRFSGVVVGGNVAGINYDFPEVALATLSGFVYIDADNNGVRTVGTDPPIAGDTVRLLDFATNAVVATTTTDALGAYSFAGLNPFVKYTLEQVFPAAPAGLTNGPVNPGLINGAPCASGCTAQPSGSANGADRIADIDLGAGVPGTQFNFGERQIAAISGTVYIDRNRDNVIDPPPTDGRIAGVTLELHAGGTCAGALLATTTTDAAGNYSFAGQLAGSTYTVCETQPPGYGDGSPNSITIAALPAGGSANNNFRELVGSLAGAVYLDLNNNGIREGGESGLAGIVITLSGTDANGAAVSRTATTDALGNYRFDDLLASNASGYTLAEGPVPAAYADGIDTVGTIGGNPVGSNAVNDRFSAVVLPGGADGVNYNFGERPISAISGTVWIDRNRDNVLDVTPTDGRIGGVTLTLYAGNTCSGAPVATTTTDAQGNYVFVGVPIGQVYTICETQPGGYGDGSANSITLPVLTAAGSPNNNFRELVGSLAGTVFLDVNDNGLRDAADSGIAGVTFTLSGTDINGNAVSRTATSDASGNYSFTDLLQSSAAGYTVTEQLAQPVVSVAGSNVATANGRTTAGTINGGAVGVATPVATLPSAVSAVVLPAGAQGLAYNFAEIVPPGEISGRVYADSNNNGLVDGGELGIAGVSVVLTGTDYLGNAVNVSVVTAADGTYRFPGLLPGTYTVTEPAQPPNTVNGITTAGTTNGAPAGTATPVGVLPSAISAITLPAGGASINHNFGELGDSPDLVVSKSHAPVKLTTNNAALYTITLRNVGPAATSGVYTVSDRLPAGVSLSAVPSGSGWTCSGAVGASSFSCTSSVVVGIGATSANTIQAPVTVGAAAASPAINAVLVEGGGEIDARKPTPAERDAFLNNPAALPLCATPAAANACRDPAQVQLSASLSGTVWFDIGPNDALLDAGDRRLANWIVEVTDPATGKVVGSARTGADGSYRIEGLVPGVALVVRFREPTTNAVFGFPVNGERAPGSPAPCDTAGAIASGKASSCVTKAPNSELAVVLAAGANLAEQSLPVDPSGVVYDSLTRKPVPGAIVTITPLGVCPGFDPARHIINVGLGGFTINGNAVAMPVGDDGIYQFLFSPQAPTSCTFRLSVTPPPQYTFVSTFIPPNAGTLTPPGGAGSTYKVQPNAQAPVGAAPGATPYWLDVTSGGGAANIVHNHIPLDPVSAAAIALTKTGDKAVVELGDTLKYTLTLQHVSGPALAQSTLRDRLPPGFTFIRGTAQLDGAPLADPAGAPGPVLGFNLGALAVKQQKVLSYRVRIGVGSLEGDGTNRAQGLACGTPAGCLNAALQPLPGVLPSNQASHTVKVTGGVFTREACVLGKIFVDCNGNHVQDAEELGIPGVRLYFEDGTFLVSDSEGKYSLCGLAPRSHVLKADPLTLPRGSRLTTSSNRNLGDAGSLWIDLKNGELHRADFIEGSCSNTVLEQVKARRAQGEVRSIETEKKGGPALRFDSRPGSPQQGTDSANQPAVKPRTPSGEGGASPLRSEHENDVPVPALPMNQPGGKDAR